MASFGELCRISLQPELGAWMNHPKTSRGGLDKFVVQEMSGQIPANPCLCRVRLCTHGAVRGSYASVAFSKLGVPRPLCK